MYVMLLSPCVAYSKTLIFSESSNCAKANEFMMEKNITKKKFPQKVAESSQKSFEGLSLIPADLS